MGMHNQTIKVIDGKKADGSNDYKIIKKSDFNPDIHKEYKEPVKTSSLEDLPIEDLVKIAKKKGVKGNVPGMKRETLLEKIKE